MNMKKEIKDMMRNAILLYIKGKEAYIKGGTRFGGVPDVPSDFEWPYYTGEGLSGNEIKPRPLSFLAQFNLEQLAPLDTEHLLPEKGILSFFYETESQTWGYDPKDKGSARVYWFENASELSPADFPDDMPKDLRFPMLKITAESKPSYPSYEDFGVSRDSGPIKWVERWDEFDALRKSIVGEEPDVIHKLLGWADPIQGNMTQECELVSRGYYLGNGWDNVSPRDRQETIDFSVRDWLPLFQLDSVCDGDFELSFGDSGRIYYYIKRDDLKNRRFEKAWLVLQCC